MSITWEKLETFTGTRTVVSPAEGGGTKEELSENIRDIKVRFQYNDVIHERNINVCFDEDGNYDEEQTDARIEQIANSVKYKIEVGVISSPEPAPNPSA